MKKFVLVIAVGLFGLSNGSIAQAIGGGGGAVATPDFNFLSGLIEIDQKKVDSEMEGTFYIDDDWREGNVLLTNELLIEDYPLKYDMKYNMLEFKFGDEIKVCPDKRVAKFNWRDSDAKLRYFVNCKNFEVNGNSRIRGFFEVVYNEEGAAKLFAKTNFKIQEPTYNVALDVGDRNSKIIKNDVYYLVVDGIAYLFTKNKNDNLNLFNNKSDDIKKFMKSEKLKFSKREDLIETVQYYNSL